MRHGSCSVSRVIVRLMSIAISTLLRILLQFVAILLHVAKNTTMMAFSIESCSGSAHTPSVAFGSSAFAPSSMLRHKDLAIVRA
ncbi:hypothetical protein RchiOBHm_Chr2g0173721 [Rosa chinensis]|uniref:Uncharacterized protein n=1 Tax=Rosa chinensis TaxID=74649 RepID=A0A2P6S5Y7_ROSCH|nr:hypothetical protein RchiOBHm_Chr2g0173721 [Rosa chinensis]